MYFRRSDGALFVKRGSVYLSRRYPLRSTENRLLEMSSIENPEDYTIIKKIQYNQMMNNLFNNNKLLNKDDKYKPGGVLEDDISDKDLPEHVFHQGKLWDVEKNWFRYGRLMLRIGDNMKITKLKNCRYACLKKKEITD